MVNKHHQFPKEADKSFHGSSSASFLLGEQDDQIDGPWKSTQKNFKYLWLVFARALGAARNGNIDAARKDLYRLRELRANLIKANSEGTWREYWVSQLQNNHQIVTAWITYTQGGRDEALQICVPLPIV